MIWRIPTRAEHKEHGHAIHAERVDAEERRILEARRQFAADKDQRIAGRVGNHRENPYKD